MRINKLWLKEYRNLQDFEINFDDEPFITVIMGRNGTGKSYLLEAIIEIFRDLDLDPFRPPFSYKIDYEINDYRIVIDADPERDSDPVQIVIDGEERTLEEFNANKVDGLPKYVFGYYSGFNDRLRHHFGEHLNDYLEDLQNGKNIPLRRMFYAIPDYSQFVLLSFFLSAQDEEIYAFLKEQLRIESLHSVLFVIKRPKEGRTFDAQTSFWGVRGLLNDFLKNLYELALAPIHVPDKSNPDQIYLYIKDVDQLRRLAQEYLNDTKLSFPMTFPINGDRDFFQAVEGLFISSLIESVRIFVTLSDQQSTVAFRELSEGEQQLLTVLGLLRFTQDEQSLFLLDEPDTHLNPNWSFQYLEFLKKYGGASSASTSQMILATHSPLVIASLKQDEVRVIDRDDSGKVTADRPESSPRGMGVDGILTSDIFGLRSTLDPYTLELLDKKRELATIPPFERTPQDKKNLSDINRQLDELRFTRTSDDPLYELFTEVMTSLEDRLGLQKTTLTASERQLREDLASQVLKRLLDEMQETE